MLNELEGQTPSVDEGREVITSPVEPPQTENSFKIPDEYASKGWIKSIKEEGDLWKKIDNLESLVGRKEIGVPDWSNEEQVKSFYEKLAPQDIADYEIEGDSAEEIGQLLKSNGVAKPQAKALLDGWTAIVEKQIAQTTSKEGYEAEMTTIFGKNFEEKKQSADKVLTSILTAEEMETINKDLPNQYVGLMYKIAKGLIDNLGYAEGTKILSNDNKGKVVMSQDEKLEKHKELAAKLQQIKSRSYTDAEVKAVTDQITQLYK
jgi:hypothetical protein